MSYWTTEKNYTCLVHYVQSVSALSQRLFVREEAHTAEYVNLLIGINAKKLDQDILNIHSLISSEQYF